MSGSTPCCRRRRQGRAPPPRGAASRRRPDGRPSALLGAQRSAGANPLRRPPPPQQVRPRRRRGVARGGGHVLLGAGHRQRRLTEDDGGGASRHRRAAAPRGAFRVERAPPAVLQAEVVALFDAARARSSRPAGVPGGWTEPRRRCPCAAHSVTHRRRGRPRAFNAAGCSRCCADEAAHSCAPRDLLAAQGHDARRIPKRLHDVRRSRRRSASGGLASRGARMVFIASTWTRRS